MRRVLKQAWERTWNPALRKVLDYVGILRMMILRCFGGGEVSSFPRPLPLQPSPAPDGSCCVALAALSLSLNSQGSSCLPNAVIKDVCHYFGLSFRFLRMTLRKGKRLELLWKGLAFPNNMKNSYDLAVLPLIQIQLEDYRHLK